ncbi:MAG: hypothetical protein IPK10_15825 [Bacteroidetes bacterium]|nr:hypothetical protein [Bacteroidota bacterium]
MSVIITGNTPTGILLVTDAFVTIKKVVKSYKDCRLSDKIFQLNGSKSYCSIVGDEILLYGIKALDDWYFEKNWALDFSKEEIIQKSLVASKKFIQVYKRAKSKQPENEWWNSLFRKS